MKKTMKSLLAVVLCFAMLASFAGAIDVTAQGGAFAIHTSEHHLGSFTDAPDNSNWKYQGLNCAVANGVMNGHDGKLRPDDNLTRAELTTMMVRVLNSLGIKADISSYVDVVVGQWYYDYIASGVAAKIINGSGNKMMPNSPITREQTFALLARTFLITPKTADASARFNDDKDVSSWAEYATNALIDAKVVLGDSTNTLRPKANVTRAELAAMLDRIVCYFAKKDVNYNGAVIEGSVILDDASIDLTGATIKGDLYIVDGVGNAKIDLSGVTVDGRIVIRGGDVTVPSSAASQVVRPEDYNEGTTTPPVVDEPEVDEPKEEEPKEDEKEDNNVTGGGSGGVPAPTTPTVRRGTYVEYDGVKLYADEDLLENKIVHFDLSSLADSIELDNIYIDANVTVDCTQSLGTIRTNTVTPISSIISIVPDQTNNVLVPIAPGQEADLSIANLRDLVEYAYLMYTSKDANNDYLFRHLFINRGISVEDLGSTYKSSFRGKMGATTYYFEFVTAK